ARFIIDGGNAAMVSIQNGRFVPMYFKDIIDPKTGKTRVRMVDVTSEYYDIARRYMIRLSADDFDDPHELAKYAATAGISLDEFRQKFHYIVEPNDKVDADKKSAKSNGRAAKLENHLKEEVA
ncbi:MAG: hypothetical protein ACREOI_36775, partial [bacterium]